MPTAFPEHTGAGNRHSAWSGDEASQSVLVLNQKLPGVRRVQHVFRILLRQLRQFRLQRFEPRPGVGRQIGSGLAKIRQSLMQ